MLSHEFLSKRAQSGIVRYKTRPFVSFEPRAADCQVCISQLMLTTGLQWDRWYLGWADMKHEEIQVLTLDSDKQLLKMQPLHGKMILGRGGGLRPGKKRSSWSEWRKKPSETTFFHFQGSSVTKRTLTITMPTWRKDRPLCVFDAAQFIVVLHKCDHPFIARNGWPQRRLLQQEDPWWCLVQMPDQQQVYQVWRTEWPEPTETRILCAFPPHSLLALPTFLPSSDFRI